MNNPQIHNPPPQHTVFVAQPQTNMLAIVSLVLAVLSLGSAFVLPLVMQLGAVICGHLARGQIRRSQGAQTGDGLALAALVIGYIMLGIGLLLVLVIGGSILAMLGLASH